LPVLRAPAAVFDSTSVAVTELLSTSATTMSVEVQRRVFRIGFRCAEVGRRGGVVDGSAGEALLPVTVSTPSLTLVATVKLPLKFRAGLNVTAARAALTSDTDPLAVQVPVPALKVEVTVPKVPVLRAPAAVLDSTRVAVTVLLSTSATRMSVRFSGVSSV
jgi:hypothetical protein